MENRRIGVFICHCGSNIAGKISIEELMNFTKTLPNVNTVKESTYTCSTVGQDLIKETVKEDNLTHVVVAACSPTMHEKTFRSAVEDAGLNPYLLSIANIREMSTWVTLIKQDSLEKAKKLVAGAVKRVVEQESLIEEKIP
ncbi:MAG: hypothetical protein ACXAC7_23345, partial [Candidatus Hodarchaeales archaeon]